MTTRERAKIVTEAVEAAILPTLKAYDPKIRRVSFQYGHPVTVQNLLKQWEQSPTLQFERFPAIFWVEDIPERGIMGDMSVVTPRILILHQTSKDYSREQRQELVFKPILWPIARMLERKIEDLGYFQTNYQQPGTITERPFWGREGLYGSDGNILDAYLDAIEITNRELTIIRADACSINI